MFRFNVVFVLVVSLLTGAVAIHAGEKEGSSSKATAADKAVAAIDKFIAEQKKAGKIDLENSGWKSKLPKPPKATFSDKHDYFWVIETNKGTIKVKLMPKVAPMHVSSTIYLSRLGFYDELIFHRVITRFMAQGGCPFGRGNGSPGYKYAGEFDPKVKHDRPFLLSMANAGPNTDGSQFFLTFVPTPWLDGKHTIFGEVSDGREVVRTLEKFGTRTGQTIKPLVMKKTTIEVKAKK